jgi:hypothetical protein
MIKQTATVLLGLSSLPANALMEPLQSSKIAGPVLMLSSLMAIIFCFLIQIACFTTTAHTQV